MTSVESPFAATSTDPQPTDSAVQATEPTVPNTTVSSVAVSEPDVAEPESGGLLPVLIGAGFVLLLAVAGFITARRRAREDL
jgi:hypothetical protein